MLIDTHNHLDFPSLRFFRDSNSIISSDEIDSKNTTHHIIAGVEQQHWQRIIQLSVQTPTIFYSLGLHPLFLDNHQTADLTLLKNYLEQYNPIAIGECGLDFWHGESTKNEQLSYLAAQLELAVELDLPIILHARKSNDLLFKTLKSYPTLSGVIHSFSGSLQQAERFIDLGFCLGFGGAVTYERANRLRKVLTQLPDKYILLETDAPDQPPSFAKNQLNHPNNLYGIAEIIAEIRQTSPEELISQCNQNAIELFSLPLIQK